MGRCEHKSHCALVPLTTIDRVVYIARNEIDYEEGLAIIEAFKSEEITRIINVPSVFTY